MIRLSFSNSLKRNTYAAKEEKLLYKRFLKFNANDQSRQIKKPVVKMTLVMPAPMIYRDKHKNILT